MSNLLKDSALFVNRQEDAAFNSLSKSPKKLTNKVELHRNWVFFQRPLQQRCFILALLFALFPHRFILHFYFPLFFSATKTRFFPATVTQVSDLPQPLFHCCPSQISELEWPPPKSVIVGIKQIKIDFYSSGRSDFTEIMAA